MALTPSPISCLPKPLLLPDTLFPQSLPFLHRDYPYPKKTPHLTTSQNDTSRFSVSFLHLLQPFHSHPSNTPPPPPPPHKNQRQAQEKERKTAWGPGYLKKKEKVTYNAL